MSKSSRFSNIRLKFSYLFIGIILFNFCSQVILVSQSVGQESGANELTAKREPAEKKSAKKPGQTAAKKTAANSQAKSKKSALESTPSKSDEKDAETGPPIKKIVIVGNKKIEVDAILAKLASKTGAAYSTVKIREDLENLFKSGFFYDVRVDRQNFEGGVQLTYTVVEKPSILEVKFVGNSEIESDELKTTAGIKAYEVLDMSKIREATEKIQKLYEDKGYFLARVNPKVEPAGKDARGDESVQLVFDVQENDKVKVKRISILGNKQVTSSRIKGLMQTQEGGFFSFVSSSGSYKQDAFDRDVQLIQYLYFSEGYIQVKVDRPQVYVTPDKKGIYITVRVEEGDRYKVGSVDFAGDILFSRTELEEATELQKKTWYEHETLLKDIRTLQAKYGDLGYAYTNVIPRTKTRDKDKEVDISFEIDKGNKVYFGKINVVGNTRTRDKVVRRELMIKEGELFNETRRRESLDNVRRLGFFDDVAFNQSNPSENQDLMNIDIAVKERNTGTVQVGAGYSTYSGMILNGQLNQINLMGRGQKLGVAINFSNYQSDFTLNFTEPYFLDTDWTLGGDLYQQKTQHPEQGFNENRKGMALRVGYPITRFFRTYFRYKLDSTVIDIDKSNPKSDPDLFPVPTDTNPNPQGNPNGITSSVTVTLEYDKRNDRFTPSDGIFGSGSIEYAGVGGDKLFTKGIFSGRFYQKTFWDIVFRSNLTYGFIRSNDPSRDPPYNELYQLGGANSLRGFNWYSIAKRKYSNKIYNDSITAGYPADRAALKALRPFGGTQELFLQTEFEFPLITEAGIKGVVFFDVGNADDVLSVSEFRSDVGFGFRWFSPIGPLRFEWGFPLDRKPEFDEGAVQFNFAIGAPF